MPSYACALSLHCGSEYNQCKCRKRREKKWLRPEFAEHTYIFHFSDWLGWENGVNSIHFMNGDEALIHTHMYRCTLKKQIIQRKNTTQIFFCCCAKINSNGKEKSQKMSEQSKTAFQFWIHI